jgi:hypothetical protein
VCTCLGYTVCVILKRKVYKLHVLKWYIHELVSNKASPAIHTYGQIRSVWELEILSRLLLKCILSPMPWEESRYKSLLSYCLAKLNVMKNLENSQPSDLEVKSI